MAIEFEKFRDWAESRFGDIIIRGDEIMINSVFCEDYKRHLSCNPSGGKTESPYGVYHCWKSDEGGTLVSLVMKVDNCSFEEALDRLGGADTELRQLEAKVNALFLTKQTEEKPVAKLELPESTHWINSLDPNDFWRIEAEEYLKARKLNPADYMICTSGKLANRIIIPYFDQQGTLIYWNGRFLTDSEKVPKYRGPHKDCGVGKGDVIYMPTWPAAGSTIHLTEGEFDAKSISRAGLYGAAIGGKELSDKQIALLRPYIPVLCFDTDAGKRVDAGGNALVAVGEALKKEGFDEVYYVRPPQQYKDWNKMLVQTSPKLINVYIQHYRKLYTTSTSLEFQLKGLGLKN